LIDARGVTGLQTRVVGFCILMGLCDGFDNQTLAFAAPSIAQEFGAKTAALAPVFSAGLFGLLIGSLLFGAVADRLGRKPALLLTGVCFGLFTLLTPLANSFESLAAYRFLAGLGIGGLPPALASMVSEFSPKSHRSTFVTWAQIGIPLGGFLGGFVGAALVPAFGWRSVFLVGGGVTLALTVVAAIGLMETLPFLMERGRQAKADKLAIVIAPDWSPDAGDRLVAADQDAKQSPWNLLTPTFLKLTLLFWAAEFIELALFYILVNWTPSLLRESGITPAVAILGSSALNLGAVLGSVALGPLCSRYGTRTVTAATFALTAVSLLVMANGGANLAVLMPALFFAGAGVLAGQAAVVTLMSERYPTPLRSTGVGAALTVGRLGAIISPALVAVPLAHGWSVHSILLTPILPALIGGFCIFVTGRGRGPAPRPDAVRA
jgi:AAHS family 4-hydroxybenzoate transporter-like MFS transporter